MRRELRRRMRKNPSILSALRAGFLIDCFDQLAKPTNANASQDYKKHHHQNRSPKERHRNVPNGLVTFGEDSSLPGRTAQPIRRKRSLIEIGRASCREGVDITERRV